MTSGKSRRTLFHSTALAGALALSIAGGAVAQERVYNIPAQPLAASLRAFANASGEQIIFAETIVRGRQAPSVQGAYGPDQALAMLLADTGLIARRSDSGGIMIIRADQDPQSGSAAQGGATVEALIVTAQKREEDIQDVPIAISAFSQEDLTRSQVAGGPDLFTQVPNMTFTKTNFTGYSIQIRGIGTQAISATTDPAVAVAFNNTPFIRNHFFEQEFYDLQRVEVLRGPQGTLYGRNATAGVVNVISAKPKFRYEAKASGDISNFNSTRVEAMVNIPLVEDAVALRVAGAWTKRDGYATNEITGNPIDGRDLWSTRVSLRFAPPDARFDANLIWEHFEENDDRLRSGKQLCHKDEVTEVAGLPVGHFSTLNKNGQAVLFAGVQALFSQGCKRGSLYSPDAFQTPNGLMLPYYLPLTGIGLPAALSDPYLSTTQSQDLRVIESTVDPEYRAKSDIAQLQISFDITDNLTLASETAYSADTIYSLQDFNRFNTAPGAWAQPAPQYRPGLLQAGPDGGIFCDSQLGCSDRLVAIDISTAESRTFSQEFRLSSDFDGALNFSLGANYLRYDTEDKYYVLANSFNIAIANGHRLAPYIAGESDNTDCLRNGALPPDPLRAYGVGQCIYMDPNPIESLNDLGHNYFLSRNPYKLISYAAFGEIYYELSPTLKVTGGLRWTVDKKEAPRILSQLFVSKTVGYPVAETVSQEWREPTGRIAIDWKPDFSLTDETLLYASFAHGYKAGGANPPRFGRAFYGDPTVGLALAKDSETRPKTFDAEYIDAFELGAKNTLADGRVTLNLATFYYDYKGYQISEIVERSAYNQNFDATVWGVELEADWRLLENLRLGFKGGYQKTRIADGEHAVDLMDRTAGHDGWMIVRPFPTQASSCILPDYVYLDSSFDGGTGGGDRVAGLRGVGNPGGGGNGGCELAYLFGVDPQTGFPYVPNPTVSGGVLQGSPPISPGYPGFDPLAGTPGHPYTGQNTYNGVDYGPVPNNGEGFNKDLSGNELPNAPNWTATITADYTIPLVSNWLATLHTDLHWQSESWWRVFNDHEFGRLDEYFTMNLAAIFTNEEAGWNVMAYIKNVTDETAITGAFLFSDDVGLTTNAFLTEPRLYGIRVTKTWDGGPLLGSFGEPRGPDRPYLFELELGGQVQRQDAPNARFRPDFLDEFAPEGDLSGRQDGDFDWGDGRDVRLVYKPDSGWRISLGARFGETNRGDRDVIVTETLHGCTVAAPCDTDAKVAQRTQVSNYGGGKLVEHEEHTVADFLVGRDFGIGMLRSSSTVSLGLRYAQLESTSDVALYGQPDWFLPPAQAVNIRTRHHDYYGRMEAQRDFEGFGPVLSWEGASRLIGDEALGHIDLDWSVSGGVLFGKQRATITGNEQTGYYNDKYLNTADTPVYPRIIEPFSYERSDSVTSPMLGATVGMSYTIDRISLGAGYRWERYYDAIDGGIDEREKHDRTIDGPYFKIAVGFGG